MTAPYPVPPAALWAKSRPFHPLWKHLLDTAAVSLALPNPLASDGWTPSQTAYLVGLHDVGKADAYFQHQDPPGFSADLAAAGLPPSQDARCRHERLSARFVRQLLIDSGVSSRAADSIQRAIVAHHGYWDESSRGVAEPYARAQAALDQLLRQALDVPPTPIPEPQNHSALGMRLAGHIVLCDWIASNEEFFTDPHLVGIEEASRYFAAARQVAESWISRLQLSRPTQEPRPGDVVPHPRPLQSAILNADIPPGLVIIEAPMGEGKTEAAWILVEKWGSLGYNGMYMALPTMATSDSLHARYRTDYLSKLGRHASAHLVHGMAWLRDDLEPAKSPETGEPGDDRSAAAAWFRPTRRALLAQHGVGTVDQAMLAGMNVKFGFLRMYGLDRKVLVIDEVHAYDAYMSAIICRLLQWCACLEIPVILLSATLSASQRQAMVEAYAGLQSPLPAREGEGAGGEGASVSYPLITIAQSNGEQVQTIEAEASSTRTLKFVTLPGLLGDAVATAKHATAQVEAGGCCCVILNTVKQAQAVYRELGPDVPKLLFHARFTAADRERLTNEVLDKFGKDTTNRPEKFILVATQVVEQSLDVDFDHMITEIAPMDLLLQRSGRLHRHRIRETEPTLHVLIPGLSDRKFGGTGYVYASKPLLRTVAILAGRDRATLPADFRVLIERTYGTDRWHSPEADWDAVVKADEEWIREAELMHSQGTQFALNEPSRRVFRPVSNAPEGDDSDDGNGWRAKTRLGANDRTCVLVTPLEGEALRAGVLSKKAVKDLYRRSVKIARYLPLFSPCEGYGSAIETEGRLKGLLLLPVPETGVWRGKDDKMNMYEIGYAAELGLLAGKVA